MLRSIIIILGLFQAPALTRFLETQIGAFVYCCVSPTCCLTAAIILWLEPPAENHLLILILLHWLAHDGEPRVSGRGQSTMGGFFPPSHIWRSPLSLSAPAMNDPFYSICLRQWPDECQCSKQSEEVIWVQMLDTKPAILLVHELVAERLTYLSPASHSWASLPTAPS